MSFMQPVVHNATEGLRLSSGPGRDLVFKLAGPQTGDAFDYFTVDVAPWGGPPLHVHYNQDETIHVMKGRFKVRIGEEEHIIDEGGFAFLPKGLPHAFLNLTGETAELIVVYVPGGGHHFYAEFGPLARSENPDRAAIAALFKKYGMELLGPPLTRDEV